MSDADANYAANAHASFRWVALDGADPEICANVHPHTRAVLNQLKGRGEEDFRIRMVATISMTDLVVCADGRAVRAGDLVRFGSITGRSACLAVRELEGGAEWTDHPDPDLAPAFVTFWAPPGVKHAVVMFVLSPTSAWERNVRAAAAATLEVAARAQRLLIDGRCARAVRTATEDPCDERVGADHDAAAEAFRAQLEIQRRVANASITQGIRALNAHTRKAAEANFETMDALRRRASQLASQHKPFTLTNTATKEVIDQSWLFQVNNWAPGRC